jgi:L-alanine-DL-glutamate epimerase-like enolase superfamily enzyme
MQITRCEVIPLKIKYQPPVRWIGSPDSDHITALFVRLEARSRRYAWGCSVIHPSVTGEQPEEVIRAAHVCAEIAPDLHPTNLEYSLAELAPHTKNAPSAMCAFDLAFYDLLGLFADMPLYRLLGGYRNRIQTSVTIPISSVQESVELASKYARLGFRMIKIKGGRDAQEDVQRVHAIHRNLPDHVLRLDADGGYTVREAIEVSDVLKEDLEMLEQPTSPDDLDGLREVTKHSSLPILADQSVKGSSSALGLASGHAVDGLCVKVATCGGLHCARQVDAIARAAHLFTMISCVVEPALLIAAGLSLALSSPNVRYADLDGSFDLIDDPTEAGFHLEDGWMVASEVPGLGCTVNL